MYDKQDSLPNKLFFLGISTLLLIADQISKWFVTESILRPAIYNGATGLDFKAWLMDAPERLPYHEIPVTEFFNWVMVWNQGVSFGLFAQGTDIGNWLLIGLTAAITLWFVIWLFITTSPTQKIAISMVIGGAIGNVIDRFRFGAVVDFLDFHAFGWHYPAFNIADSCIVLGVFILIFYALFFEKTVGH